MGSGGAVPNKPLTIFHEDGNGEKLTVKKWWLFGCRFVHGLVPIFSRFTAIFHGL